MDAIGLILSNHSSTTIPVERLVPQKPTTDAAVFFDDAKDLIAEDHFGGEVEAFIVPDAGRAYLRLYPSVGVPPLETELEARRLVTQGDLWPMGVEVGSRSVARNAFGGIAYEAPVNGKLYHFTQLFLSREIWGVDSLCVNADVCKALSEGESIGFIATGRVEEGFVRTLRNFLNFAKASLQLSPPLRLEAGLVGIKGYQLGLARIGFRGKALEGTVKWQSEVVFFETPSAEILGPFFNLVWSKCGIERSTSRQTELVEQFRNRG